MKKESKVVTRSPELARALRGFMPVFANEEDRRLVAKIESHNKILRTVDNTILRSGKNLTKKMKDLLENEKKLVEWIIRRNMDF